jgi:Uma2 family endonuclease
MTTLSAPTSTDYPPAEVARLSDEHGKLYELVAGALVEKPAMSQLSNWIAAQLAFVLRSCYPPDKAYVIQEQPTYCFNDPREMRRPDVLLVWAQRLPRGLTHDELHVAPDFAAEVVSPTNTWFEIRGRVEEYLGAGVPLVWVVEPDPRSIHAYRKDGSIALYRVNETVKDEPLLPGLSFRVADIFPAAAQPAGSRS